MHFSTHQGAGLKTLSFEKDQGHNAIFLIIFNRLFVYPSVPPVMSFSCFFFRGTPVAKRKRNRIGLTVYEFPFFSGVGAL
jgi:hypothetical protein